jgi:hypothetical protein
MGAVGYRKIDIESNNKRLLEVLLACEHSGPAARRDVRTRGCSEVSCGRCVHSQSGSKSGEPRSIVAH